MSLGSRIRQWPAAGRWLWRALTGRGRNEAPHQRLGRRGEALAARHLKGLGYRILDRNFAFGRREIDLVAGDGETIVFVEVKTRQSIDFAPPETAVDERKRHRIRGVARVWFERRCGRLREAPPCRFDIVAVEPAPDGGRLVARHIKNAFAWRR